MPRVSDREFEDFVHEHGPGLLRRARLLCRHPADADDVVQETLARLYARWNRIDQTANPAGYAHRVLYRVFLDTRRRASRRELSTADPPEVPEAGSLEDAVLARQRISEALSVLKPVQRIVLVARYLDDQSVDEVASALHRTPGWVRVTSFRALQSIRDQLPQFGSDDLIPQGERHV